MRHVFLVLIGFGLCGGAGVSPAAEPLPQRWVYVSRGLGSDRDVADIRRIVATASAHGLNGMMLAAGLDRLDLQPAAYFGRLEQVRRICAEARMEIVPIVFSAGYGSSVLAHDRNLAAGIPVTDVPLVVRGGEARLDAGQAPAIVNGGFEKFRGNRVEGAKFHDGPGQVSFIDTAVARQGKASLRFENFGQYPHGHGRVMFELPVRPHRSYRVTCWVKTENLDPTRSLRVMARADNRDLGSAEPNLPATGDWRKVTVGFSSRQCDTVSVYAGVWNGKGGRFWIDDLQVEPVALVNVLRRPGTPLVVRDAASETVYTEGTDFAPVADPKLNFRLDHDGPPIRILPGSRIREGQSLRVSYYQGVAINAGQVTVCMSEPKLYEIWEAQTKLIHQRLAPKRWMLSMDEIRAGGSCQACKSRRMTMGQILGDCLTRQFDMIRRVNPQAEVYTWSDMLDPNHNCRGNYYLVEGNYTGAWNYVPRELRMVPWYDKIREKSLAHFSQLGFKTLAGAYYDRDTLDNPQGWLESLRGTPGAVGIMYTTWRNKYELLGPFGDLVSKPQ